MQRLLNHQESVVMTATNRIMSSDDGAMLRKFTAMELCKIKSKESGQFQRQAIVTDDRESGGKNLFVGADDGL
jgi:hypothetical protein